ncbi:MAG: single-stranded DNA-binding protein [Bacilli bacterium]|nr:single-stranded DNA-binding protein [Bacilli bacterium]
MNMTIQKVRLAADPEVKPYGDDKNRVTFTGYVNKSYKKNEDEKDNHFNYVAFGATADFIAKYLHKGSNVIVYSEVNNNHYKKDVNGTEVYIPSEQFVVTKCEFNEPKKSDGGEAKETKSAPKSEKKSESKTSSADTSYYDEYNDF